MADPGIPALVARLEAMHALFALMEETRPDVLRRQQIGTLRDAAAALSRLTRELAERDHWTAELERRLRYLESHSLLSLEAERATAIRERDEARAALVRAKE